MSRRLVTLTVVLAAVIAVTSVAQQQPKWKPTGKVYDLSDVETKPVLLQSSRPSDDPNAPKPKRDIFVKFSVIIDESGEPHNVSCQDNCGKQTLPDALARLENSRFRPAMRRGVAVAVRMQIAVGVPIR